jgi:hypothetical protein
MGKFLGILKTIGVVLVVIYISFSIKHTNDRHHSHNRLEKLLIEKDSIIRQDSLQIIEYSNWSDSYRERMKYAEDELEKCQNKK